MTVLQTIALPLGYSAIAGAGASDYVLGGGMSMPGCRRMGKQCGTKGGNGVIQLRQRDAEGRHEHDGIKDRTR